MLIWQIILAIVHCMSWYCMQHKNRTVETKVQKISRVNLCNLSSRDLLDNFILSDYLSGTAKLETVQDFLIKLDIKPLMHLLEISIFSLNNDLIRLTKIMNNLVKDLKILSFKVLFQCLKLVKSFQKIFSVKNIWLGVILMEFS